MKSPKESIIEGKIKRSKSFVQRPSVRKNLLVIEPRLQFNVFSRKILRDKNRYFFFCRLKIN